MRKKLLLEGCDGSGKEEKEMALRYSSRIETP
jgi:hypothetical protein